MATTRMDASAEVLTAAVKEFALSHEADDIGITPMDPLYIFEGTRSSFVLANWIRSQGYNARAFPGPSADALLLIPPTIASGLGELGKHGSLISRRFGSGVRLAGVTTDMPSAATTTPDRFGADEFCKNCQVCTRACPPGAISEQKQRGALVCELRQMHPLLR